jgi:UDP-3-O-acyl-N-acetylglucosamine deacetylase
MDNYTVGRVLNGSETELRKSIEKWAKMVVDMTMFPETPLAPATCQTTLAKSFCVTGPGTYAGKRASTLYFEPSDQEGWWFDRLDQKDQLPVRVSVRNVWNTSRSIVLRSGAPHNYIRMVEHIIALRLGMGLDNVIIRMDSGDPPLFNVGSMDIVEGVERAGIVDQPAKPLTYWSVKEPVTMIGRNGSFLTLLPAENSVKTLTLDCAIDFPTAIGKQRIQFDLYDQSFRHGAHARTNCSKSMMLYCKTIGKLFADTRNLGYTNENILIAGKDRYHNEAKMLHDGKSLEAVWHRAILDLVAALSLIETGRLVGRVVSYKAGHALDVQMVTQLYLNDLLVPVP